MHAHFSTPLSATDPDIAAALDRETVRQQDQIELIASENIVSRAVRDALGHIITNKTLEGYPGNRFHGGGVNVDLIEDLAIERAKKLFGCDYANVQPHSGSQANLAVFFLLLKPGDKVLSLDLAAGGHLSHGLKANLSGRWFDAHHYGVDRQTEVIDYDALEQQAMELKPKLLIAGGSAYPRALDFERMGKIAKACGAWFHVDMAHIAGLVAGGVHASPFPHADIVTCTTTKTLRGPRGGLILTNNEEWMKRLQSAVFPGVQGSLHTQVIVGKAICLGEALNRDFWTYASDVQANARRIARTLSDRGLRIVTGGTDTHIVLVDVGSIGIIGKEAEAVLEAANITANKNPIPGDVANPMKWTGLRLGSSAITTRGFSAADCKDLALTIADLLHAVNGENVEEVIADARKKSAALCDRYRIS